MSGAVALVLLGTNAWHVGVRLANRWTWHAISADADNALEANATRLAQHLDNAGFTGGGLVLGLPAGRCLAATFAAADLPRGDYNARLFRFEQQLPLSAEQMVAEFSDHDGQAFGVAAEREWVDAHVTAIEAAGVAVDAIVPTALLALGASAGAAALLVCEPTDPQWQLLIRAGDGVGRWLRVPASSASLTLTLRALRLRGVEVKELQLIGAVLPSLPDGVESRGEAPFASVAENVAESILAGRSAVMDFRRHGLPAEDRLRLNRSALNVLLSATAAALLLFSVALGVRGERYRVVSDRNQQRMMTRFHEALPGWPTPSNFMAVVNAERRRLDPERGSTATVGSALQLLSRVTGALPQSEDFTIDELTLDPQRFDLSGTIQQYETAQAMGEALRAAGLEPEPAQAHRLPDNRWQFSLSGQTPAAAKAAAR